MLRVLAPTAVATVDSVRLSGRQNSQLGVLVMPPALILAIAAAALLP
jgi:hypothetical protein